MATLLADFVHIGHHTSLYTPPQPTNGELIIICSWLGAARKHIAKYTTLYQRIAPRARILLMETAIPIITSSYAQQRDQNKAAVSAVVDALVTCGYQSPPGGKAPNGHLVNGDSFTTSRLSTSTADSATRPKILLHTFSNGGGNTATQLLIAVRERLQAPLPLVGLLFDSCPAKGTYWKSYNAMVLSLPRNIALQMLGPVVVHCILIYLYTWIACGYENPASLMRRTVLDPAIVQAVVERTNVGDDVVEGEVGRATYIYSKSDQMVEWTDIRDHAQDARSNGWQVEEILIEGSGHCAHYFKDEERYVETVKSFWLGPT
ncbi:MAG: hypothetical protein M1827_006793 [Pycnora praestabilis]|nr:MAG: hypothetical protein M1827_006793 [Pycnora praestabilis]